MSTVSKTLGGYYRFQYADSTYLYLLRNAKIETLGSVGLMAEYSVDDGRSWMHGGFFPFDNCNQFYRIKRLPHGKSVKK